MVPVLDFEDEKSPDQKTFHWIVTKLFQKGTAIKKVLRKGPSVKVAPSPARVATLRGGAYPLFVVIPKDDVIPKFSFFGIFTGNFSDLKISRDSTDVSGSSQNSRSEKFLVKMPKNENFGITSSFGITTNRGYI